MFKAHVTNCSGKKLPNHGVGNMSCPYDKCPKRFMFKIDLCEHLYADHKADIKPPETHLFKNFEEFSKFKTKIEDETYSYYSQQFGKRNGRTYYYCQHDGAQKSHRRNDEATRKTDRRNKKGPIKKNNLCLSMMAVKCLPNGSIQVAYRPTHLHPCRPQDLKHQPLSTETNQYISKLLSWNVPPSKIVECLRGDSYKRNNRLSRSSIKLKRDNLVKKKTITERMRKKKSSLRFSNNDAESVYMKVNKLIQENYNPVLMYKPLGEKTIIGPKGSENLPDDVFVLAIQSKEQLEMMVEGCKEILVIDETHSTNSYDYKLLNLMVRDKFNLGYPVGHAICHPSEETTLQYVFKAIKERCPDLSINCCITDDDPKLINSVNAGLGEAIWHLLCVWHIHRTIQSNLRERIKDNDLVNEIYGIMCVLIEECDESQFIQLKDSFLNEYSNNCPEFTKYFNNTFFPKAHKWAKCYRLKPHAETETTMLVESFHNILKTHYMKRAPCKRLDDLIDLLLDIEEDYYVRYTNSVLLKTMSDKDHRALSRRHLKGIEIKDSDVTLVSERFWTVKSQEKDSSEVYSVVMCADQCSSDSCIYACCYCDTLCSHLFSCSCPDMFPLCKHIHKVFSMIELSKPLEKEKKEPEFFLGAFENNIPLVEETAADSRSNYTERSVQQRIQKIREIMEDFDKTYLDNSPVKRILPQIETTLTDLQTQCKVLCFDPPRAVPEMEVKTQTAPNEKLQKQLTPFVKKTKKRKPTALKKPHKKCVTEIKDFLLQEHQESEENVDSDLAPLSELNHEQATGEPTIDIDNPLDVVIEYQGIKVLSLHLKALNPTLDERELPLLLQADSKFVHGYLYDEVINIFLKMICNESVYACDTTVAQRLCSGNQNFKSLPKKLSSKEFILFPGNSGNHWIIIVAEVKSSSLWLYNSLSCTGSLLSTYERQMLSAVAKFLKNVFIETKSWSIKRHFDIQKDTVSCGVHICWFALLLTRKYNLAPLENPSDFRQHIYDSILLQKDL
ncbi:uncharacterized protein LOC113217748 [Frankliniella occidentalis]|uniref:Uncharacterized protein LOC113217748 n=2 Tax=Frankliniella occidentalis TaxID=133901 RepID=A0A9C6TXF7_FRAOC|nr:uncharacterized protein LOC113217748 [Frankliniella occidentalis]XP_052121991.1 uncharacterized protein LOC113217748 [Frankliniella occidentalis]